MECNRDEAVRAKTIADTKLENQDILGAKKFALKAQSLYPQLEGLSQMLSTIDVYVSASNKIAGEVDWYSVLGVSPTADEETVKRQYRKLALLLHPDKNKSPGADGAFKLICEAWNLLSDKSKRLAYNQKRSLNVPMRTNNTQSNGVFGYPGKSGSASKGQVPLVPRAPLSVPRQPPSVHRQPPSVHRQPPSVHRPTPPPPVPRQSQPKQDTFWTICYGCKMHYEYLRKYINHTLLCPNCEKAFLASESPPPFKHSKSTNRSRQQNNTNNHDTSAKGSWPGLSGAQKSGMDPSIAVKAANVVQQAQERMKREHYGSLHTASGSKVNPSNNNVGEGLYKKARFDDDNRMNSNFEPGLSAPRKNVFDFELGLYNKPNNSTRELTSIETRNMLMHKARKAILEKLNKRKSHAKKKKDIKLSSKERKNENGKRKAVIDQQRPDFHATDVSRSVLMAEPETVITEDPHVTQSMDVPDSDFHDFDEDRTERCFEENDIWAGYDDDDGMPRFYAFINKVISRKPFKLKLGWINSKTNTEFSNTLNWVGSGFYKTCGEFRLGRYEINKSINVFSHKVKWSKGPRGIIQIYPKKGDVWALYRNWAPEWNEETPEEIIHKYDMVVVLEDYKLEEEEGVLVAPLVKVVGFKTVFSPHSDPDKTVRIPKEEMFRFSHQVPHYMFTGEESLNAPKGCLELDPAATQIDLLEVVTNKDANFSQDKVDKVTKIEAEISEFEEEVSI